MSLGFSAIRYLYVILLNPPVEDTTALDAEGERVSYVGLEGVGRVALEADDGAVRGLLPLYLRLLSYHLVHRQRRPCTAQRASGLVQWRLGYRSSVQWALGLGLHCSGQKGRRLGTIETRA